MIPFIPPELCTTQIVMYAEVQGNYASGFTVAGIDPYGSIRVVMPTATPGRRITPREGMAILAQVRAEALARRQAAFDDAARREAVLNDD